VINPNLIVTVKLGADQLRRAIPGGEAGIYIPIKADLVNRPLSAPPGTVNNRWLDPSMQALLQSLQAANLKPELVSWRKSEGGENFAIFVAS
jgi:hypothetical protein